jgi:ABC-type antimicrobial peptide transport system permease subunit
MASLDRELRSVDARIIIGAPATLGSAYEEVKLEGRIVEWAGGIAGTLQLALALMATWGLVAYAVERRSAEIAIRRALGATDSGILRLVMRPSLWLFAAGGAAGCAAGVVMAKMLHAEFLGLGPIDLRAVVPAVLLLGLVVVFAAWIPARRATTIEPASLLRQ